MNQQVYWSGKFMVLKSEELLELLYILLPNRQIKLFTDEIEVACCGVNHEVPFVIDTPFARIDTEHRENISKHFFSKLNGQVFILSTNEEINSKHVGIMKEKM